MFCLISVFAHCSFVLEWRNVQLLLSPPPAINIEPRSPPSSASHNKHTFISREREKESKRENFCPLMAKITFPLSPASNRSLICQPTSAARIMKTATDNPNKSQPSFQSGENLWIILNRRNISITDAQRKDLGLDPAATQSGPVLHKYHKCYTLRLWRYVGINKELSAGFFWDCFPQASVRICGHSVETFVRSG